jgi:hypothetical protein
MKQPRRDRLLVALALAATLTLSFAWSCARVSAVYAQDKLDAETEAEMLKRHEYALVVTVMGETLGVPSVECGQLVENALIENRALAVDDDECREVMMRALEIKRTSPPITITGPPAQEIPTSEGPPYLGNYSPTTEPAAAKAVGPPPAPIPEADPPFANKSAD